MRNASGSCGRLGACLVDVEVWLKASWLRLNTSKTQVMWLGSAHLLNKVPLDEISVLSSRFSIIHAAKNLGVVVDTQLSMSAQFSVAVATVAATAHQVYKMAPSRH
jgi:hypothetical protein